AEDTMPRFESSCRIFATNGSGVPVCSAMSLIPTFEPSRVRVTINIMARIEYVQAFENIGWSCFSLQLLQESQFKPRSFGHHFRTVRRIECHAYRGGFYFWDVFHHPLYRSSDFAA